MGSIAVTRGDVPGTSEILTPAALEFVAMLHRAFDARRRELLDRRVVRQSALDVRNRTRDPREVTTSERFAAFTTLLAYDHLD